jgi:hypothetical protein
MESGLLKILWYFQESIFKIIHFYIALKLELLVYLPIRLHPFLMIKNFVAALTMPVFMKYFIAILIKAIFLK